MSFTTTKDELSDVRQDPTLDFYQLPPDLPCEITYRILQYWMAPKSVTVEPAAPATSTISEGNHAAQMANPANDSEVLFASYACATDTLLHTLPEYLQAEYWRIRHLSWLQSVKVFRTPYDFYMSHWLLSLDSASKLPFFDDVSYALRRTHPDTTVAIHGLLSCPHPYLSFHGLERIELDFNSRQYFALFNVHLPPFEHIDTTTHGDERHHDEHLHGAASFLQHTHHLVLRFGTSFKWAHPWSEVLDFKWTEASRRPKVCDSGLIIDWILEYAWDGCFLQHIHTIELMGDIQPWVKAKWEAIFAKQAALNKSGNKDPFAVHKPVMSAMELRGMIEGEELDWQPEEHYPPMCECEVGCWRLWNGEIDEDEASGAAQTWEEYGGDDGVVGDWDKE